MAEEDYLAGDYWPSDEDEDEDIYKYCNDLAERINLIGSSVIALNKRVVEIERLLALQAERG